MAERVSASITIGGSLTLTQYGRLCELVIAEGLCIEWDGRLFEAGDHTSGDPLSLFAHEVAYGSFHELEAWCGDNHLPFARWAGAYSGQWGARRVVFLGQGQPIYYPADEDDCLVIDEIKVRELGSIEAILAYFETAETPIPQLIIGGAGDVRDR